MRRSGYNALNNAHQSETNVDEVDKGSEDDVEEAFIDYRATAKPYKTLSLIFFLFFMGLFTLITSTLIMIGHLDNDTYADRMIPLMILGMLMFVPGVYYVRIVYFIVRGRPGYTYDSIPSCS